MVERHLKINLLGGLQDDVRSVEHGGERGHADLGEPRGLGVGGGHSESSGGHDLDVVRVEQPAAVASGRRRGVDREALPEGEAGGRGLDETTVAAQRRAHVHRAVGGDVSGTHVSEQQHRALLSGGQRAGLDHAVMVDRGGGEVGRCAGREKNAASVGTDGAAVVDERIDGPSVDRNPHQSPEVERDAVSRGEQNLAAMGMDRPLVHNLGRHHGHGASRSVTDGRQIAPIDDDARAGALKNVPAGHEVGVSHRQSGGHDRCRAHLRPGRKQDTVGVDQEEGAVCGDAAGDAGSIPAHHAVEGHR